jgi:hypothetical protein
MSFGLQYGDCGVLILRSTCGVVERDADRICKKSDPCVALILVIQSECIHIRSRCIGKTEELNHLTTECNSEDSVSMTEVPRKAGESRNFRTEALVPLPGSETISVQFHGVVP